MDARLGPYTIEEIAQAVHHHLGAEATAKRLGAKFHRERQLRAQRAAAPHAAVFEEHGDECAFLLVGDRKTTTILSNLGPVALPEAMAAHVTRMEFVLGPLSRTPWRAPR